MSNPDPASTRNPAGADSTADAPPAPRPVRAVRTSLAEAISAVTGPPTSVEAARPAPPGLGRTVHQILRGRYALVVGLGLLTGGLAAGVAWKEARPVFKSEGLVRIAYTRRPVKTETDQNAALPMFETFMQSQRLLITSRRTIDAAIQDPVWKTTGRQVPPDPDRYFASNMAVEVMPRSEFIQVSVSDTDPATAAAAVTSVINSYADLYNSEDKQLERQRIGVLEDQQASLQSRVDQLNADIQKGSQEYGSSNLDMFYETAAFRVTKLEAMLSETRTAIATASKGPPATMPARLAATRGPRPAPGALTVEQIAASDPVMLGYLNEQTQLEKELDRLLRLGLGEAHRSVAFTRQSLEQSRTQVIRYVQIYNEFHSADQGGNSGIAGKSLEELRESEAGLEKLHKAAKDEMVVIGNKCNALHQKKADLQMLSDELLQLAKRIDSLRTEESLGGRLTVVSTGEIPLSADKDPRRKLAGAAGAAGASLPTALLLLMSMAKRRYRYSKDTEDDVMPQKVPLLGIVPELSADGGEDRVIAAAHSVHQVRVSLQSQEANEGPRIYLVTSTTAGEGKTSLTMSLGLSYAASRLRTLVIDGDIVGRRLTRSLDAQDQEGLQEAIASGSLIQKVKRTEAGLYVLGSGNGNRQSACAISPAAVRSLLTEARTLFDVVLIDTGPMLGSLEASVFAREVDGVLFTIARGQERQLAEQAMHRLRSLGVRILGCVFNRAKAGDFHGSSYYGSYARSLPADPKVRAVPSPAADRFTAFGPLVRAVAADVPVSQN